MTDRELLEHARKVTAAKRPGGQARKRVKSQMWGNGRFRHCHYCGAMLTKETATLDHRVPLSEGGGHHPGNISFSCKPCNAQKGSMPYREFKAMKLPEKRARRAGNE